MIKYPCLSLVILTLTASPIWAQIDASREVQFVSEYISALSETENIRADAEKSMGTNTDPAARFSECVHTTQLQMHAMADEANQAATYKFSGVNKDTPALVVKFFAVKGMMFNRLSEMCQAMVEGPKPGVDYSKLNADMPKLRADMEYADKNLLPLTTLVFNTLTSSTPDKRGHMSQLIITRKERADLVHQISASFKNLDSKNVNYTVSSAALLRDFLLRKGYRCADDPT